MYEPEEPYVVQKTPGTKEYTVPFHLYHILEKAKKADPWLPLNWEGTDQNGVYEWTCWGDGKVLYLSQGDGYTGEQIHLHSMPQ